jgi:hypothetical protein
MIQNQKPVDKSYSASSSTSDSSDSEEVDPSKTNHSDFINNLQKLQANKSMLEFEDVNVEDGNDSMEEDQRHEKIIKGPFAENAMELDVVPSGKVDEDDSHDLQKKSILEFPRTYGQDKEEQRDKEFFDMINKSLLVEEREAVDDDYFPPTPGKDQLINEPIEEKQDMDNDEDYIMNNNNNNLSKLRVKPESIFINLIGDDESSDDHDRVKPEKNRKKEKSSRKSSSRKSSSKKSKDKKESSKKRKRSNSLEVGNTPTKKSKRNHVSKNNNRVLPLNKKNDDTPILIKDQIIKKDVVIPTKSYSKVMKIFEIVFNHLQKTNTESFQIISVMGFHQLLIIRRLSRQFTNFTPLNWINIRKSIRILNKRRFTEVEKKSLGKNRVKVNAFIDYTYDIIREAIKEEKKFNKTCHDDDIIMPNSDLKNFEKKQNIFINALAKNHQEKMKICWEMTACQVLTISAEDIEENRKAGKKILEQLSLEETIIQNKRQDDKDMKLLGEKQAVILKKSLQKSIIKFDHQQKKLEERNRLSMQKRNLVVDHLYVIWFFVLKWPNCVFKKITNQPKFSCPLIQTFVNGKEKFIPLIQNLVIDEEQEIDTGVLDEDGTKIMKKIIVKKPSPAIQQFKLDQVYSMNWFNSNDMEFVHWWQNTQNILDAYYYFKDNIWKMKKRMQKLSLCI